MNGFTTVVLKILSVILLSFIMFIPFILEYSTFSRDKKKKQAHRRFRMVVFAVIYSLALVFVIRMYKDIASQIAALSFVQKISSFVAVSARVDYFAKIVAVLLVNAGIGLGYVVISKFVRIGIGKNKKQKSKKSNEKDAHSDNNPAAGNESSSLSENAGDKIIEFFTDERWFFIGDVLFFFSILLMLAYFAAFILIQLPAAFGRDWMPYDTLQSVVKASYLYPALTLMCIWEFALYLRGLRGYSADCPEYKKDDETEKTELKPDLEALDLEIKKEYGAYYVCDVELTGDDAEVASVRHSNITTYIAEAVEKDKRNPQEKKEVYLNCLDKLVASEDSLIINGSFFSEFSLYFFRYLSAVVARGDNIIVVCNSDPEVEKTYDYIYRGFCEISSLYCKEFTGERIDYDNPIWRMVKVSGEHNDIEETKVGDAQLLVTTLSYLCSERFDKGSRNFISFVDEVIFVDSLNTINNYGRQLSVLNTHLKHIAKENALALNNTKNGNEVIKRYISRQVRYICFDDTRTPGIDKILKNSLDVEFESADSMRYNSATMVRCYNYEAAEDENGKRSCSQNTNSDEELGVMFSIANLCVQKGASAVKIFTDDVIPYDNFMESLKANSGQLTAKVDGGVITVNTPCFNPDGYTVVLALDSENNLPATVRKYASMMPDKPALLMVFSRPYMLRDYYAANINTMWKSVQNEYVPVAQLSINDLAQRILVKANSGGIGEREILFLASGNDELAEYARKNDLDSILREILDIYGISREDRINLFSYFVYNSDHQFDENGKYNSETRVELKRNTVLYDAVNGCNNATLCVGDSEYKLTIPKNRLAQNFIEGQNFIHNGVSYYIYRLDTDQGYIYAKRTVGGKNDEVGGYLQSRVYNIEAENGKIDLMYPLKHIKVDQDKSETKIGDVFVAAFRTPMDVVTKGYYDIDPHTMSAYFGDNDYHSITDEGNIILSKQIYRRYGQMDNPYYSSEIVEKDTNLLASEKGALAMSVRIDGNFGTAEETAGISIMASAMLNELLHLMFPSVAEAIAVCPVADFETCDENTRILLDKFPHLNINGECEYISGDGIRLLIIEDSPDELGVISVLMSGGSDVLSTLFSPIYNYLKWYPDSPKKNSFIYFGLDSLPACFNMSGLLKLSELLGDDKYEIKTVEKSDIAEYRKCSFCEKRYAGIESFVQLKDGRLMCHDCEASLVSNSDKLKNYIDNAGIFLESTYGIDTSGICKFCFESTENVINTLKNNGDVGKRGSDIPVKSYMDADRCIHIEKNVISANLSELIVRNLTYAWQLENIPDMPEDLAEGQIALTGIQYLNFLCEKTVVAARKSYYESTGIISGKGYRRLVNELLNNPQYHNNSFRYLLEKFNGSIQEPPANNDIEVPVGRKFGLKYKASAKDRTAPWQMRYFFYDRLDDKQKAEYLVWLEGVQNHADSIDAGGCSLEELEKISDCIRRDHPELYWFKSSFVLYGTTVRLKYGASADECRALSAKMESEIPHYLEDINDSMSAYEVALRIHSSIIKAVDYDTIALNKQKKEQYDDNAIDYLRTVCGVFLNRKAVCAGYAAAFQYLAQSCGIECALVSGHAFDESGKPGTPHAWNIIKIDGAYYYVDATWDDASDTVQTVKNTDWGYDYFCLTTEEIERTRLIDLCPVDMPVCNKKDANYHTHNGLVLDSYDADRIMQIARDAASGLDKSFTVKFTTRSAYDEAFQGLFISGSACRDIVNEAAKLNKAIDPSVYSYRYNKDILTITVIFKHKK